jgi:MFS family permease
VRRFPMALGPIIGGALIAAFGELRGIRIAFGVAIAMALVAFPVQQRWIEDDAPLPGTARPPADPRALWRAFAPELRALLVSDVLIRFCEQIPQAFVVVWCMKTIEHPVSAWEFGVLTAIEMATAAFCYLPVASLADRAGKTPFVLTTFVFFALFPLALFGARSFAWLVPVFVLRGLKEFGEPSRKALILDRAPEGRRAAAFGLYYLIRDSIVSLAALGGAFLWQLSPATNLAAATIFGALGTVWLAVAVARSRPPLTTRRPC